MQIPTLRVREPREMLALIPHQLGFHPAESVVLVSLRPPRGRVGLVVRVDLTDLADAAAGPRLARALVGHLDRDGAHRAALVVSTRHDPRSGPDALVAAAAAHVREAAAVPFGDVAGWVVTSTGYLGLDCRDECCPPGGRPLRELDSTEVGAQMVLVGSAVAGCRQDVARIAPAGADARRSVARVRRRWQQRGLLALGPGPAAGDEARCAWWQESMRAWRAAVRLVGEHAGGTPPVASGAAPRLGPPLLGRIEAGLADVRVRDAVLVALVPGTGDLPEHSLADIRVTPLVDAGMRRALTLVVDPQVGVPAPEESTAVHERVLEAVVAHGERGGQAPALTLLGLLAWWRGDGARAQILLARALAADSGYRLAALVDEAVASGLPPGWVRARA